MRCLNKKPVRLLIQIVVLVVVFIAVFYIVLFLITPLIYRLAMNEKYLQRVINEEFKVIPTATPDSYSKPGDGDYKLSSGILEYTKEKYDELSASILALLPSTISLGVSIIIALITLYLTWYMHKQSKQINEIQQRNEYYKRICAVAQNIEKITWKNILALDFHRPNFLYDLDGCYSTERNDDNKLYQLTVKFDKPLAQIHDYPFSIKSILFCSTCEIIDCYQFFPINNVAKTIGSGNNPCVLYIIVDKASNFIREFNRFIDAYSDTDSRNRLLKLDICFSRSKDDFFFGSISLIISAYNDKKEIIIKSYECKAY